MAEAGLPIVHQSSPMMGGAAPMSMAAALALGNAELLSGLVIHQLVRRGAPFVYGCGLHHMDMRTTISVYGVPEFDLARAAVAEMARYYNLPNYGYAGPTDSCVVDEQAASDATSSILVALLSGQHLVHDIGYIEAGMTESPEMIVLCADIIGRLRHFTAGMKLDREAFALDLIHEIGPGGSYLTTRAYATALPRLLAAGALQPPTDERLGQAGEQTPGGSLAREDRRADGRRRRSHARAARERVGGDRVHPQAG